MNKIISKTLDLLYPENIYCMCCGDVISSVRKESLCDNCLGSISWMAENPFDLKEGFSFDKVMSLCAYDYFARQIIYNLKFHKKSYLAKSMGSMMGELLLANGIDGGIITAVPMFKEKEKLRGYNQAELLAQYASESAGLAFEKSLLIKYKDTASMRESNQEQRLSALDDSIMINKAKVQFVKDKDIILVDDVITTGMTANYCSKLLKDEGAKKVSVLTFSAVNFKGI